jgi:hypothetical protein|nr:MAG TPA: hypothetical protein [Caudoviricetes sp.]
MFSIKEVWVKYKVELLHLEALRRILKKGSGARYSQVREVKTLDLLS